MIENEIEKREMLMILDSALRYEMQRSLNTPQINITEHRVRVSNIESFMNKLNKMEFKKSGAK